MPIKGPPWQTWPLAFPAPAAVPRLAKKLPLKERHEAVLRYRFLKVTHMGFFDSVYDLHGIVTPQLCFHLPKPQCQTSCGEKQVFV